MFSQTAQTRFERWLGRALNGPVPNDIVAYHFNLYEDPFRADLVGATYFDPDGSDWACQEAFVPSERFFAFPRATQPVAWPVKLRKFSSLVRAFLQRDSGAAAKLRAAVVTVGFVDGDLHRVWPRTKPTARPAPALARDAPFFQMDVSDDTSFGVGHASANEKFVFLPTRGRVKRWRRIAFVLRKGRLPDLLRTDLLDRVCSRRLRDVIESHANPKDELQWLSVEVSKGRTVHEYFALHFPRPLDVLDRSATRYVPGTDYVMKPTLVGRTASRHDVFTYPGENRSWLVSSKVREAIASAKCSGVHFSPVGVTQARHARPGAV